MDEKVKSWGLLKVAVTAGLVVALGVLALKLLLPDISEELMAVLTAVVIGGAVGIFAYRWRTK